MPTAIKTTITELPESRVRVRAEIAAEEVQRSLENTARNLGREMKMPGFRPGKIPPPVIIQRLGRDAVLDEVIRAKLTDWYVNAVDESGIAPVGDPRVDMGELPPEGQPLAFSFEVGVRPVATVGDYRGLEVGRREPAVDPEAVDAEIEELRERLAHLHVVDRPAQNGDFLIIDFTGMVDDEVFEGGEGRDQLIELGAGHLIPGFEEGLIGAVAGDERTVEAVFPDDYGAKHVAGKPARFEITVKDVKHKHLPDIDDDFASDATGHDTLDELMAEINERMLKHDAERVEVEYRAAALDAAVSQATVEVPDTLVEARARELLDRMLHHLGHQGINKEAYLTIAGKTEDEMVDDNKPEAEQQLRREAVLAAIIEAEKIEPSEQELLDALEGAAEREQMSRQKLLDRLRHANRVDELAREVAAQSAIDLVVREAKPISMEEAEKRQAKAEAAEKLWTPEQGVEKATSKPKSKAESKGKGKAKAAEKKLWTPD
ncbi:MAG: trigger factor [Actinomycetota bacterium]|nr:trigger factor [Actinomycetota bacterium]